MKTLEDWKVIISKKSGGGKAFDEWPKIKKLLVSKGFRFTEAFTDHRFHAVELAKEAVSEGYRKILAIGGDGAIHEILNGVMSQTEVPSSEVTLGIIPVGSGNDWSRLYDIPKEHDRAVEALARGKAVPQDVVAVDTMLDGSPSRKYMMNIGGLGFDAQVCHLFDLEKLKGHSGDAQYLKCVMKGFLWYKCRHFKIFTDGEPFFEGPAFSVSIGNGKYSGGGMRQTPDAVPDDGLIDITVIKRVSRLKVALNVRRLLDGSLLKMKKEVVATKAKLIQIYATPASFMEVDGEAVGCSPANLTIMPAAIKVISNL